MNIDNLIYLYFQYFTLLLNKGSPFSSMIQKYLNTLKVNHMSMHPQKDIRKTKNKGMSMFYKLVFFGFHSFLNLYILHLHMFLPTSQNINFLVQKMRII